MKTNYLEAKSPVLENPESSIQIGIATTFEEKREIYHLRYQIYVEEMSMRIDNIDSSNQLVYDELDEWATLLYARKGARLIGTARINIGTLVDFSSEEAELLSLHPFQECNAKKSKLSFVTKMMVTPDQRNSAVLYLLMAKCYDLCSQQSPFMFGICNVHLLRLYEQTGFHRYKKNVVHPNFGLTFPIVMVLDDVEHYHTVRSPLYRLARKRKPDSLDPKPVEWFYSRFTKHSSINSQLIKEEELWEYLCDRLQCPPTEAITLLHSLTIPEAKKFLHNCSSIISCDAGDRITTQGEMSYSYNILLYGKLQSLTFKHPIKEYAQHGQHFGTNGFTEHNMQKEDIAAITTTEVLVLSSYAFPKFSHTYPEIAHKIMRQIIKSRA
ncbi:MAG: cyclic nucleotide-binding protein [Firmicutes bacterium]|nr:cyclic nucleotide-binding protein [Bacillota bacterium]